MFGTRDLFHKSEKISKVADRLLKSYVPKLFNLSQQDPKEKRKELYQNLEDAFLDAAPTFYIKRLYQQAKQISQIIAYIWRWADTDETPQKEVANKLKKYFTNPTEDTQHLDDRLKKLLGANPRKIDNLSEEDKLLKAVFFKDNELDPPFNNLLFPMFNKFELGESEDQHLGYLFWVNINSFQGSIDDPTKNAPELLKFSIPYPPCPKIGEVTVTSDELESWIANREENEYFAKNPYIPTSCS
ncbi:hypothetical protein [uncultured Nostoc sp.]|uniref:hypothetical protein n=1 Tax=uncultured Nostoc sp. TaxID=340711 RepID=UPI0035CC975C